MKKIILILLLSPLLSSAQWNQIGMDIDGTSANEKSGAAQCLNGAGNILVVGAPNNSTNGSSTGETRFFEWNGTAWLPKGTLLNGTNNGDNLGQAVDINNAGDVAVIGAPGFNATMPAPNGFARVVAWNGTNWVARGADFLGTASDDSYGTAVSINADGTIVAVAAEPFFTNSYVRIFKWNGSNWSQLGSDILGSAPEDGFGRNISLDANGNTLAIGAENFDSPTINDIGRVQVYEWDGTSWAQKGNDLLGDIASDFFGAGVAINDNGTIVSAGARASSNSSAGYAKIFEWNGTTWAQKGTNIVGNAADFYGTSTDLNGAGDLIIVGTTLGDYADILEFDGTDWVQKDSLAAEVASDQFGRNVSINTLGNIVSVGAAGNDDGGNQAGHVRVFENTGPLSIENNIKNVQLSIYPNPANNFVQITTSNSNLVSYQISTIDGRILRKEAINQNKETKLNLSDLQTGMYILSILTTDQLFSSKIIKE